MKPHHAIAKAKSYQLKSHNKMKRHLAMQKKSQMDAAKNTTAERLATIGKAAYVGRLFQNNVTRHLGKLASYGRNYRG